MSACQFDKSSNRGLCLSCKVCRKCPVPESCNASHIRPGRRQTSKKLEIDTLNVSETSNCLDEIIDQSDRLKLLFHDLDLDFESSLVRTSGFSSNFIASEKQYKGKARRDVRKLLLALVAVLCPERPNIIIILLDDAINVTDDSIQLSIHYDLAALALSPHQEIWMVSSGTLAAHTVQLS